MLFAVYGVYQGIFRAVGKAMATDFAPQQLRRTAVGVYSSVVGITALLASVVGGQLWDGISPAAMFYYGAAFAIVGSLVLALVVPSQRSLSKIRASWLECVSQAAYDCVRRSSKAER